MSSSSVCQGLQSCLEPHLIEPRDLRLKLTSPGTGRHDFTHSVSVPLDPSSSSAMGDSEVNNNGVGENAAGNGKSVQKCGWNFLDAFGEEATKKEKETAEVYVHPMYKKSCSSLSAISLEMCTENLACETGSNAYDDISLLALETASNSYSYSTKKKNKPLMQKKLEQRSSFPPPLTSIAGFGGVQVEPQREDGRLVLKAVNMSANHSYLHAERANGRLTIQLMKSNVYDEIDEEKNDLMESEAENKDEVDEEEETEEVEGNSENMEDEIGIGKFSRPSRCNEDGSGNKVLLNWERCWVAT